MKNNNTSDCIHTYNTERTEHVEIRYERYLWPMSNNDEAGLSVMATLKKNIFSNRFSSIFSSKPFAVLDKFNWFFVNIKNNIA